MDWLLHRILLGIVPEVSVQPPSPMLLQHCMPVRHSIRSPHTAQLVGAYIPQGSLLYAICV
jgi:hypothetical protein